MDYKYTAYDRIIHITEKLPKDKISEAIEIIQEDSFQDLLDFCVEQNCFTQAQAITLYDFTIVFDSLDDKFPYGKPQTDEVARGSGTESMAVRD